MNLKLSLLLLFISHVLYAQLSVRNDNFIFADDALIFVEDDINLNETNSRIYLRNEAQVIQGTGTTGNSGIGELSVYQEANVDAYEYNYWCAPIGDKTSNNSNNLFGISLLNDATGLITSTPATYNSSSNYNGTSSPLNIEPYWIWKFVASDNYSHWVHVRSLTTINPGEGFTMKGTNGSGSAQQYDFRGKPNNGTISTDVLNNQYTLTGNPYPSAMDAVSYIHDTENAAVITGVLYYWEQDPNINSHNITDFQGGYATYTISSDGLTETFISAVFNTYNSDGSINTSNTGTGSKTARRYIPIGQGFMVEGTATGTVKAKNSHRVYIKESDANSEFFKIKNTKKSSKSYTEDRFSIIPNDYKRFRLNIDFNNTYTRQLVQTFNREATSGFDYGLEINVNPDELLNSDAYFKSGENLYLGEALSFDENLKIPLYLDVQNKMSVRIRIADIQNFDASQPIFVLDTENNTFTNLRSGDFEIELRPGNYDNRFEIVFSQQSLSTIENEHVALKVFQDNQRSLLRISNPGQQDIKSVCIYDISGKKIFKRRKWPKSKEHKVSTNSYSNGVYIVKIVLKDRQLFTKKVVVTN
ncbi:T9SS sorting signal type C domain-containing protein [Seonamhaeicola sp.]|uniref:T9SS sorting signal type C domain-containing protein n=1 Tax=Seonamhaeicola sp. TaxID=1912245 RepID=UPI00261F55D8|nr:T9SS sorting signal type C domain-containing protein [Seonamhaeicola sp.]